MTVDSPWCSVARATASPSPPRARVPTWRCSTPATRISPSRSSSPRRATSPRPSSSRTATSWARRTSCRCPRTRRRRAIGPEGGLAMYKTIRTFLIVTLTLTAARAWATPATCTVSNMDIFTTLVPFPHVGAVGLVIPVDIDAATGHITMDRSTYTAAFPSPGLKFDTGFGSLGWLDWDPQPITGTMDSDGQVTFLHFGMRFYTDFATAPGVPGLAGNLDTTFTTAMQARAVAGTAYLFTGAPLNSAGQVTPSGAAFIIFVAALQSGPRLSCTLSPAVDLASLPKGPALTSVKGQVKAGTDPTAADDDLTLTAVMTAGAVPPVLDGTQDVLLRIQPAGKLPLTILVPIGPPPAHGIKSLVKDTDGSVFQAIADLPTSIDDQTPPPPATQGGSLIVKKGKKRNTFIFKVNGIDASNLSGTVPVTLGVGTQDVSRSVTFTTTKKGSKFH